MQVIWLRDKTSVLATTILGGAWGGPILDQKETLTFTDRIGITECQNFMNALTSLWICVKKPQFCQEYLEINLMAVQIEINPRFRRSTFWASQHSAIIPQ
jgi:hypothetical protein